MALAEVGRLASRIPEVHRRWGVKGVFTRGADKLAAFAMTPVQRRRWGGRTFTLAEEVLPYAIHPYNATWRGERMVEIPVARRFLDRHPGCVLEVGNVLAYYQPTEHTVVDKYERAAGVLNVDVIDYQPAARFDAILAVSTLEHVGWDEHPREPGKITAAVKHLRTLLAPHGRILVTCPRGYNTCLDTAITEGSLRPAAEWFLHRERDGWVEQPRAIALHATPHYDLRGRNAHDLWVAEFIR